MASVVLGSRGGTVSGSTSASSSILGSSSTLSSAVLPCPASVPHAHPQAGNGGGGGGQLTRSLERILEDAQLSGELKLSGRKLKDFPKVAVKYNLSDTVAADLSKNRFTELPLEVTDYPSLERLDLYHNTIRSIPETVIFLHSLTHLDLSRNQLNVLPISLCQLPLQVLIVSNNKLVSLPEEIDKMTRMMELDVSCNEIAHLPSQIGHLENLRSLNLRRNLLVELPPEMANLHLVKLDISGNRITGLPVDLRHVTTLVELNLKNNPLATPPSHLCTRGRVHVFKYLEMQAIQEDRKRAVLNDEFRRSYRKAASDLRYSNGITTEPHRKRNTVDSGYSTSDGSDKRWSQELRDITDPEEAHRLALRAAELHREQRRFASPKCYIPEEPFPVSHRTSVSSDAHNGTCSGSSTPSTLSPGNSVNLEDELSKAMAKDRLSLDEQPAQKVIAHLRDTGMKVGDASLRYNPRGPNNVLTNGAGMSQPPDLVSNLTPHPEDKKQNAHIQTYREYKEALRQQRALENGSAYRSRSVGDSTPPPQDPPPGMGKGDVSQYPRPSPPSATNNTFNPYSLQEEEFRAKHKAMVQQHRKEAHLLQRWLEEERKRLEMKNVQKEAVLSYVKSRTSSKEDSPETPPPSSHSPVIMNGDFPQPSPPHQGLPNGNSHPPLTHNKSFPSPSPSPVPNPSPSPAPSPSPSLSLPSCSSPSYSPRPQLNSSGEGHSPAPFVSATLGRQRSPFSLTPERSGLDLTSMNPNFTMRREFERAREEAEQIELLRQNIEFRLKVSLPNDLAAALMDGVVLCHLANHVRPRSVASIHVPSPAVPKLTMAKCRRNVENFLDACRRIGVEEEYLCESEDIVEGLRAGPVLLTVLRLVSFADVGNANGNGFASPGLPLANRNRNKDCLMSLLCLAFFVGTCVLLYVLPTPDGD